MNKKEKEKEDKQNIPKIILNIIYSILVSLPLFCIKREKEKSKMRKAGDIINPPLEYFFYPDKYTTYTNKYYITIYEKYAKSYYIDNEEL